MILVERHLIKKSSPYFKELDLLSFKSKNLYNMSNYLIRQSFIKDNKYLNYNEIERQVKTSSDYRELPSKVSQQVLMLLDKNWKGFFKSIKDYSKNNSKYKGRPRLPFYKHKTTGRNVLIYTSQAISKKELKKGFIKLSGSGIKVRTKQTDIRQVRVVPRKDSYVIEVLYNREVKENDLNKEDFISIDLGLNNLATITSNKGIKSTIINGRVLKSFNQYYNKVKAKLQSYVGDKGTSNRISKLTQKRNNKISDYLHKSSKYVIDMCLLNKIGKIIIGHNKQWKDSIEIGSINNQKFVSIPHSKFIDLIKYKSELQGIEVVVTEESYTSKCSFIDNESLSKQEVYKGKRVKRGLFRSELGFKINADINGALNIARKVIPEFNIVKKGIEDVVVSPLRFNPYKLFS